MTFAGLAAKNVFRNRFRAVLTVLGVAVAVVAFIVLRTVSYSWGDGMGRFASNTFAKDRILSHHRTTLVDHLPRRDVEVLRQLPHIKVATWGTFFGGKDPLHENVIFANFAVDEKTYLEVYDDISVATDQRDAWMHDKGGALVGDTLAKKMGWQIGQKVSLQTPIYPSKDNSLWQFTIDGVYTAKSHAIDQSMLLFHWEYWNDNVPDWRRDLIGFTVSRVDDPSRTAEVCAEIDRAFENDDPQTISQDEGAFQASFLGMFSAILKAVDVISVVILVLMLLILANTIAMAARERTKEYGALRALGFMPGHLAGFLLAESIMFGTIGGLLGVGIAYAFVTGVLSKALEENASTLFRSVQVNPADIVRAIAMSVALGALAAAIPAFRASRLRVVDALRSM